MKTLDGMFHVFCAFAALMAAVFMCVDAAQAKPRTASDNITQSCGPDNATKTILIAYDTIHGKTAHIAAQIGNDLCNDSDFNFKVDVKWVGDVHSVDGYDGFIVASAIYKFNWLPDALAFLEKYKDQLAAKPTAIFIDGASMSTDNDKTRAAVQKAFVDPILSKYFSTAPVSIGLFGGAFDLTRKNEYNLFEKVVLRIVGLILRLPNKNTVDWSNGPKIDAWATEVGGLMK